MNIEFLAQLFQKYRRTLVLRMAAKYDAIDLDDIDCLYTELWERVLANSQITKVNNFRQYLFICLDNRIKDYIRRKQASEDILDKDTVPISDELDSKDKALEVADDASLEAEQRESLHRKVESVMATLPPTMALVGTWYHIEDQSQAEIAERLQMSQPKVSRILKQFNTLFKIGYRRAE